MKPDFIKKMIEICEQKIQQKWNNVWLSFYVFFNNKNTDPDLLIIVASRWIKEHKLDHFEKATKIKNILLQSL